VTQDKYKNKLLIVIADYPHNVDRLFQVNAGMRSRFTARIEFHPSSPKDCVELIQRQASECAPCEELPEGASELLLEVFADLASRDGWANSRDVLTFFEAMKEARDDRTPEDSDAAVPLPLTVSCRHSLSARQ
jgi:hypothetical protein